MVPVFQTTPLSKISEHISPFAAQPNLLSSLPIHQRSDKTVPLYRYPYPPAQNQISTCGQEFRLPHRRTLQGLDGSEHLVAAVTNSRAANAGPILIGLDPPIHYRSRYYLLGETMGSPRVRNIHSRFSNPVRNPTTSHGIGSITRRDLQQHQSPAPASRNPGTNCEKHPTLDGHISHSDFSSTVFVSISSLRQLAHE